MNINEIAKLAGVSRATVSRYLNQGYVSSEKKQAIQNVIEKTGYEPSLQAQNLRKKVTKLIGVIIPRIHSESVSRMVEGISSVLAEEEYQLLLANTQNNEQEELKYLKLFRKKQVDGIIFMGTIFSQEHFRLMREIEIPLVIVGQRIQGYSCVYQDDYHAAYDAAMLLVKKGKIIGYIGVTEKDEAVGAARKRGFLDAMKESHQNMDVRRMAEAGFGISSGYDKAKEVIELEPDADSFFCVTDSIAVGVLKYLHDTKREVPAQVQLIGFGDTELGNAVTPAITTVHFFYRDSGVKAAELLLDMLRTGVDLKKEIKMGYEIIENASLR